MSVETTTRLARGPAEQFDELSALHELERRMFGQMAKRPVRVGRYELASLLGRGGLADVFRAYDPDLERDVAIKIVRRPCATAEQRDAVLAEARSLARLSHPNIVPIYDVGVDSFDTAEPGGEDRSRVYIVMELVEGARTLREWLRTDPSPHERLRACVLAGEGLAAAHAAGVLHRDFKPDNVLVAGDRVLVIDFGLAVAVGREDCGLELPSEPGDGEPSEPQMHIAGTPAYMALEQHLMEPIGMAADVFAYCVSVVEVMFGKRPFEGATEKELRVAKESGPPRLPARRGVSLRLSRALRRGLQPEPGQRPSMHELLAAGRSRLARPRRVAIVGVALATTFAAATLQRGWNHARDVAACDDSHAQLDEIWNEPARARVAAAFSRAGDDRTRARVEGLLDAYVERWTTARTTACTDTHVERSHSVQDLALRNACLDRARAELGAAVDVLAEELEPIVVEHAIDMAAELPDVELCLDTAALREEPLPPATETLAQDVAEQRRRLAQARVLHRAGQYARASEELAALASSDAARTHEPLLAEIALAQGSVLVQRGDQAAAEEALERAYELARRSDHHAIAKRAALEIVPVVAGRSDGIAAAHRWADLARIEIDRRGTPAERAVLEHNVGLVWSQGGDHRKAITQIEQAIVHLEAEPDADPKTLAILLNNLGNEHVELEEPVLAAPVLVRALALKREHYGAAHPRVARALFALARVQRRLGELKAAEDNQREVLAMLERMPSSASFAALVRMHLGANLLTQDRAAEAKETLVAALAELEAAGAERGYVALATWQIGIAELRLGHRDEARRRLEQGIALHEGQDEAMAALASGHLGRLLLDEGDLEGARPLLERAVEGTAGEAGHASILSTMARLQLTRGDDEEAAATARRALTAFAEDPFVERRPIDRRHRAETQWVLARAMQREDPVAARAMAELARHELAGDATTVAAIDAWLATD